MAFRDFRDELGATWTAWDTYPQAAERTGMSSLNGGWLTFENGSERRRLVPAPVGWAEASDETLRQWLAGSTPVRLRVDPTEPTAEGQRSPEPPRRRALDQHRLVADSATARDEIQELLDRSRETIEKVARAMDRPERAFSEPPRERDPDTSSR